MNRATIASLAARSRPIVTPLAHDALSARLIEGGIRGLHGRGVGEAVRLAHWRAIESRAAGGSGS